MPVLFFNVQEALIDGMVVEIGFALSASLKNKNVYLNSWPIWQSNYAKCAPVRPGSVRAICEKGFIVYTGGCVEDTSLLAHAIALGDGWEAP